MPVSSCGSKCNRIVIISCNVDTDHDHSLTTSFIHNERLYVDTYLFQVSINVHQRTSSDSDLQQDCFD